MKSDSPNNTTPTTSPAAPITPQTTSPPSANNTTSHTTPLREIDRLLPPHAPPAVVPETPSTTSENSTDDMTSSDYYFNSYAHFGIHEEMLKDSVRTRSYQRAILDNAHLFRGKTVLDVGCGTGVLSMFAAQAGAAKVYAVECSRIVDQAKIIIKDNGWEDVVKVVDGKVEEISLKEEGEDEEVEVDIIISEWMGYFLFYESMLDTVIYARDKWLRKDGSGMMFPDKANLYMCGIEDGEYKKEKIDFWDNVYGFKMDVIKKLALTEPLVDNVDPEQIITNTQCVFSIDMAKVKKKELEFVVKFRLGGMRNDFCHALVAWFDVVFSHCHKEVRFGTGPLTRTTHWKQTVFYLDRALVLEEGEAIEGLLACRPNKKNPRDLDIAIEYSFKGRNEGVKNLLRYRLR